MKYQNKCYHQIIFSLLFIIFIPNITINIVSSIKSDTFIQKLKNKTTFSNINNIITALQLGANDPCEDKYFIHEIHLSNKNGYMMSVFDGHGGWVLSEYVNLLLYPYFLEEYNSKSNLEINEEKKIVYSLQKSISRIEEEFKLISYLKYQEGNKKYKNYGSCALITIVIDNKLYTSTLGDSKARLFSKENNDYKIYKYKKVSKVFNCRKKEEQKKLKEKWPNIADIYICKREKVCYVKGRLQPTSALGDYYLKTIFFSLNYKKVNDDKFIENQINSYEGPFIDNIADIKIYDLNKNDKYLIIGSDGLWDYLSSKQISNLLDNFIEDKNEEFYENKIYSNTDKIAFGLMKRVVGESAKKHNLDPLILLDIPLGKRLRRIHDDITIIICDLSNF